MAHTATTHGIKVGEGKVEAIQKMKNSIGVIGVKRILGMCQYLIQFLPNINNFNFIKEAITKTPALAYYDVNKATTIQL